MQYSRDREQLNERRPMSSQAYQGRISASTLEFIALFLSMTEDGLLHNRELGALMAPWKMEIPHMFERPVPKEALDVLRAEWEQRRQGRPVPTYEAIMRVVVRRQAVAS